MGSGSDVGIASSIRRELGCSDIMAFCSSEACWRSERDVGGGRSA